MNFRDRGIIISKKTLKENNYVLTVFTQNHGIYAGVLKQYSKKNGDSLAEGNLIDFFWNARLHEHLGYAKAELVKSYNSYLIQDKTKLYAFNAITELLKAAFCEREPHNNLFPALILYLESMKENFCFQKYFNFELAILAETGYRLQLDACAVTNKGDDLYYVSPKSGRAVSKQTGEPYEDKLLRLPRFDTDKSILTVDMISDALKLTSYFFSRYIFINKALPLSRQEFYRHLSVRLGENILS